MDSTMPLSHTAGAELVQISGLRKVYNPGEPNEIGRASCRERVSIRV